MNRRILLLCFLGVAALGRPSPSEAADKLRFWNLTSVTIVELYLAPAGTTRWTTNQCDNDTDKAVDSDERLDIVGVAPGRYDVKLTDKAGRRCMVHGVEVKAGGRFAFSLEDADLKDCTH